MLEYSQYCFVAQHVSAYDPEGLATDTDTLKKNREHVLKSCIPQILLAYQQDLLIFSTSKLDILTYQKLFNKLQFTEKQTLIELAQNDG